jgi:hypothetical protein
MTRSKTDAARSAAITEIEATDLAIAYLATLPDDLAKGTAVKAALFLYAQLEVEAQRALSGRKPSFKDILESEDRQQMGLDLAKYSKYLVWKSCPDECVRKLLRGLSPKAAVFVALSFVEIVCGRESLT